MKVMVLNEEGLVVEKGEAVPSMKTGGAMPHTRRWKVNSKLKWRRVTWQGM